MNFKNELDWKTIPWALALGNKNGYGLSYIFVRNSKKC